MSERFEHEGPGGSLSVRRTRRAVLKDAGYAGIGLAGLGLLGCGDDSTSTTASTATSTSTASGTTASSGSTPACTLAPEMTEGPYYVDLERSAAT